MKKANVALIGLGKMGLSHLAIANASKEMNVVAICDASTIVGQLMEKYLKIQYVPKYEDVIKIPGLDAVVIATPTRLHAQMIQSALDADLHVFCEKPLTLSGAESTWLAEVARSRSRVAQVGYHNRFVATFDEARRLLDLGVIGRVRHVHAQAYGAVVLRPSTKTWRSDAAQGGGCLYDYAAHPINLMNWYIGQPETCTGADLTQQYSDGVDDAVYANLRFANGVSGQVSVNWSDETIRKMTTQITIYGDGGKVHIDRQELQVYVGANGNPVEGYGKGWTVRYITELTPNVDYYLRGEEYSAQMDSFGAAVNNGTLDCVNDFASAAQTDVTLEMIRNRALGITEEGVIPGAFAFAPERKPGLIGRVLAGIRG